MKLNRQNYFFSCIHKGIWLKITIILTTQSIRPLKASFGYMPEEKLQSN